MLKSKKLFALLMALVVLFSSSFAVSAEETIKEELAVRVSEVEVLRETNSETYLMSDGTYQCVVYAEDKYYSDENGELQLIDNSIIAVETTSDTFHDSLSDSIDAQYKNAANAFDVVFSSTGTPTICIASNGNSVTFSPATVTGSASVLTNTTVAQFSVGTVNNCSALGQLTATGNNTVSYDSAFANADLVYVLENSALKEYIILENSAAASEYSFLFTMDGLSLETADDNAFIVDKNDNVIFTLGDLFAIDANGILTENLSYSFTPISNTNKVIITISLDEDYLTATDRTFPVIIDPSIMISSVETADACVCDAFPNTNYRTAYQLRTGKDTDYGIRRSYIRFDIPESVPIYGVQTAVLELEKASGSAPTVYAYRVTDSWNSSSITWANKPGFTTTGASTQSAAQSDGIWYSLYVTQIVRSWVNGATTNYGFALVDANESDSNHWTTFYSSDASSPHKPELNITYTYGCKSYVSTTSNSMNCQGYAFFTNDNPTFITNNDYVYFLEASTSTAAMLERTKLRLESWLDTTFPGKWRQASDTDNVSSNQWLVAMRVGKKYLSALGYTQYDYHFWYRTNTGTWANKHGTAGASEELPSTDTPETDTSSGWALYGVSPFYDSDTVYYIITQ